ILSKRLDGIRLGQRVFRLQLGFTPVSSRKEFISMKKFSGIAAVCLLVVGAAIAADTAEKLESGLPVGETVPPFNVRDITGPSKGKTLCYRCQYSDRPVVTVFTRELSDNVKDLVKKIDAKVGENKDEKMAAFVVVLTEDPDAVE